VAAPCAAWSIASSADAPEASAWSSTVSRAASETLVSPYLSFLSNAPTLQVAGLPSASLYLYTVDLLTAREGEEGAGEGMEGKESKHRVARGEGLS
jgi:hypothetical protein